MGRWLGKILAQQQAVQGFFVSPSGGSTNSGAIGSPWDFQTALNGGYPSNTVQPGNTIWMRGGTYTGIYTNYLNGTGVAPIKIRQYPGEQPIIDANVGAQTNTSGILNFNGNCSYTWYIGIGMLNSFPDRYNPTPGSNPTDGMNGGMWMNAPEIRTINCIIHDVGGEGIDSYEYNVNGVLYGNLIYYTGWNAPDRGHGHGIYINNVTAPSQKLVKHNILGQPAFPDGCNCIQSYGSSASGFIDSEVAENVFIHSESILGGHGSFPLSSNFNHNLSWQGEVDLGYNSDSNSGTSCTFNYFCTTIPLPTYPYVFAAPFVVPAGRVGVTITDNTFTGQLDAFNQSDYPSNTYFSAGSPPTTNKVVVWPNAYEANRAHVVIYNWEGLSAVNVDLSSALTVGTPYNIFNAQDYFAGPVQSGTYGGGTVSFNVTGLSVDPGMNFTPVYGTDSPDFCVFIVRQQGA